MPVPPPGLVFCLLAAVLLTFVSVSAPTWDKIYFLRAGSGNATVHFGVFGFSGTPTGIGYRFSPSSLDFNDRTLNTPLFRNLARTLILHPIAAGLAGLAFLSGVCGATYHRAGTVTMVLLAAIGFVVCLLAFICDMVLFGIARDSFIRQGIQSQYGNACWLTLAALVALLLGFSTAAYGVLARYKKRKRDKITAL
ncbi:pali-domain-containing protein [Mycena pura]|uniref:Pali-domain-containing protein n=1 Tax=Mycena pura TaxID=153505 RepID=A0AAD6VNB9_9AGAR|nr:pali-domain-containing protein [Mycena pura]